MMPFCPFCQNSSLVLQALKPGTWMAGRSWTCTACDAGGELVWCEECERMVNHDQVLYDARSDLSACKDCVQDMQARRERHLPADLEAD